MAQSARESRSPGQMSDLSVDFRKYIARAQQLPAPRSFTARDLKLKVR
jgi:hypothetical protein